MSSRRPTEFAKDLIAIRRLSRKIEDSYRWLFNLAHSRPVGEVKGISVGASDPTGSAITNRELQRLRARAEQADKCVRKATALLQIAHQTLEKDFRRGEGPEPGLFPRSVSRSEERELRAAQRRRHARGEGWGES